MGRLINPFRFAPTILATVFEDPHRYWRVKSLNGTSTNLVSYAEIEMAATVGGADQCSGGTVIYGSQFNGTSEAAANAFDNNASTRWTSGAGGPYWVGYDFGSAVYVRQLKLSYRNDGYLAAGPLYVDLEWSDDGTNWTLHASFAEVSWTSGQTKTWTMEANGGGEYDHWRWVGYDSRAAVAGQIEVAELAMASSVGGANLCTGGTSSGTMTNLGNAFDGNLATNSGQTGYVRKSIEYAFASPVKIKQMRVTCDDTAGTPLYQPADMHLQYRESSEVWRTAATAPGQSAWTTSETRSVLNPALP